MVRVAFNGIMATMRLDDITVEFDDEPSTLFPLRAIVNPATGI